jgi:hypothetical protein
MMKFFPGLLKALSAVLAPVAVMLANALVGYFSGSAPSDVSPALWVIIGGVAVFLLNFLIGKLPTPPA